MHTGEIWLNAHVRGYGLTHTCEDIAICTKVKIMSIRTHVRI